MPNGWMVDLTVWNGIKLLDDEIRLVIRLQMPQVNSLTPEIKRHKAVLKWDKSRRDLRKSLRRFLNSPPEDKDIRKAMLYLYELFD